MAIDFDVEPEFQEQMILIQEIIMVLGISNLQQVEINY